MCTVSWIHNPGGYELFCNRDELLTRKPAFPPQVSDIRGVRILAPRDGDFGGSWIGVNEFGLSLSLLNLYQSSARQVGPFTSRGLLLMDLAQCRSQEQLIEHLTGKELKRFQPFTLLALEPDNTALIAKWDGGEFLLDRVGDRHMPLTSSSFDSAKVVEMRKRNFYGLMSSVDAIDSNFFCSFHSGHEPAASAYSTCMHRDDAETVSFSRISVSSDSIEFRYYPHSPCRIDADGVIADTKTLPRKTR